MQIRKDPLTDPRIIDFLRDHLADMHAITPPESVHALDLDGLRSSRVTFWSAWERDDLLGCGALMVLDDRSGEIKSMRTAPAHRGKGIASAILSAIIHEADNRGYRELFLETGSMTEFAPARALYEGFGFRYRGPFGDYEEDPNSVFMFRSL